MGYNGITVSDWRLTISSINNISVIGLGTMGSGIAQCFAAAGFQVRCFDDQPAAIDALPKRVESNVDLMIRAGIPLHGSSKDIVARLQLCSSEREAVQSGDFVVEAVLENLQIKRDLFQRLEETAPPDAVLATNTSSLRLADMTSHLHRRDRLVVTHWFNPPQLVPVVEVVPGADTSASTMDRTTHLMAALGKTPVRLSRDIPGFIVNRVQVAMIREVWHLLESGVATAEDIDTAIRGSMGFRLAISGPLEINDFGGLDIWKIVYENLVTQIESSTVLPSFIQTNVERGRLGVKTGGGIFEHPPETTSQRQTERDEQFVALYKLLHLPQQISRSGRSSA